MACFSDSCFILKVSPAFVFPILLPVSVFLPFCCLVILTCVSSALPLMVLTCIPLPLSFSLEFGQLSTKQKVELLQNRVWPSWSFAWQASMYKAWMQPPSTPARCRLKKPAPKFYLGTRLARGEPGSIQQAFRSGHSPGNTNVTYLPSPSTWCPCWMIYPWSLVPQNLRCPWKTNGECVSGSSLLNSSKLTEMTVLW